MPLAVNRRLDEWVKLEQLDLDSVETVVDEKVEDKVIVLFWLLLEPNLTFYLSYPFGIRSFSTERIASSSLN